MIGAAVVASLLFAALLAWYFSRPIRALRSAFEAAAAGDLAPRFGPATKGLLKDISTGKTVGVTVTVTGSGVVSNAVQGHPIYGTPASVVFDATEPASMPIWKPTDSATRADSASYMVAGEKHWLPAKMARRR